jgi:hypothetical protein
MVGKLRISLGRQRYEGNEGKFYFKRLGRGHLK